MGALSLVLRLEAHHKLHSLHLTYVVYRKKQELTQLRKQVANAQVILWQPYFSLMIYHKAKCRNDPYDDELKRQVHTPSSPFTYLTIDVQLKRAEDLLAKAKKSGTTQDWLAEEVINQFHLVCFF